MQLPFLLSPPIEWKKDYKCIHYDRGCYALGLAKVMVCPLSICMQGLLYNRVSLHGRSLVYIHSDFCFLPWKSTLQAWPCVVRHCRFGLGLHRFKMCWSTMNIQNSHSHKALNTQSSPHKFKMCWSTMNIQNSHLHKALNTQSSPHLIHLSPKPFEYWLLYGSPQSTPFMPHILVWDLPHISS